MPEKLIKHRISANYLIWKDLLGSQASIREAAGLFHGVIIMVTIYALFHKHPYWQGQKHRKGGTSV